MEFNMFHITTFLMVLVAVASNAAILPPQMYWNFMLPTTPMPKAITNLLEPVEYWREETRRIENVAKKGYEWSKTQFHVKPTGNPFLYGTYNDGDDDVAKKGYEWSKTQFHGKSTGNPFLYGTYSDGDDVAKKSYEWSQTQFHVKPTGNPFLYGTYSDGDDVAKKGYEWSKTQFHVKPTGNPFLYGTYGDGDDDVAKKGYKGSQTQFHGKPTGNPFLYGTYGDGDDNVAKKGYEWSKTQFHGKPTGNPFLYGTYGDGDDDVAKKGYKGSQTQFHGKPTGNPFLYGTYGDGDDNVAKKGYEWSKTQFHGKPTGNPFLYGTYGDGDDDVAKKGYEGSQTQFHGKPTGNPFLYGTYLDENDDVAKNNLNATIFFFEKDLQHGTKLNMQFTKTTSNPARFWPRQVANSIPFSSNKMDYILNKFSINKGSNPAKIMKNTLKDCEFPTIKGEEKLCATSLESMIDFTTSMLGENVEAFSTEVNKESGLQQYRVLEGVKKLGEKKNVVCHKQNYPYVVFFCHKTETATTTYSVPLEGADGNKVNAITICHTDTSEWNPNHLAFKILKVKPGTVPVCHFLPEDHVVWVPKQKKTTTIAEI